jgi:integrase
VKVASCPDCLAWGVTARYGWMCVACKSWREKYGTDSQCSTCGRNVPVSPDRSCRLCHKHRNLAARLLGRRIETVTLAEANAHGQQLFIAGTWRPAGTIRREYVKKTISADMSLLHPVTHRQPVLFDMPRDLRLGLWDKFPPPPDPALEAAFHQFVADHAAAHGWAKGYTATIQRGIRIMLGIQDTPGAPIRRSDILLLTRIKHSAATVTDMIAAAGMLEDDIEPQVVRWFHAKTAGLPEQMRRELAVWLEVMRNGSTITPRSKPRSDDTIRAQLAFALPTLRSWAAGRDSLREISRADVLAVLPRSGQRRATTVQGLRSIFRILRARKLVFTNPTFRIHVPAQAMTVPPAVDLAALRDTLDSPSPARAVITALLAYHAIRLGQLAKLQLTDIRGGRLHLDDRVILLAKPVRDRVDAYLNYRAVTWPATVNAYLFIHARSWKTTRPVTSYWIGQQLPMPAEHIRLDRIYQEVEATGGDIRALCDLFGMSIANAARWATTIDHFIESGNSGGQANPPHSY